MLHKSIQEHLNTNLNIHFTLAYFYLALNAYFRTQTLNGFAIWAQTQCQARLAQANTVFSYIDERNGDIDLQQVCATSTNWESPLSAVKNAYQQEQKISQHINNTIDLAKKQSDKATIVFLNGFVQQQIYHESALYDLIQKLTFIGNAPGGIFMLDASLGQSIPAQSSSTITNI